MAPRKNHLRNVTERFSLTGQIIGVDTDTMTAHQSRTIFQKIPFGTSSIEYIVGVYAYFVENQRQFIYKRDIHIALSIFDNFRSFGHFYAGRFVCSCGDNRSVKIVYNISNFGC
ncbi:hypothetical protein SDC9_196985 [bioreactor metagenome]|uniref:Uncharacterized protein n=1 Tax=bioreactor metagenome TaxID=1076179 RepID=A0A645IDJ0_9ZZZZ